MRLVKNRRGQFVIIAALLISIMIISSSAVLFSAVTYFEHERWEEYIIVIDGVKSGTDHVLELSLANHTNGGNSSILRTNLDSWKQDVKKAYSGFGTILGYTLASGTRTVYGMNLNYSLGLASTWNQPISFSAANATQVNLNISSVGLTGYSFVSTVFLKMDITDALWYSGQGSDPGIVGVRVVMYIEGPAFLTSLQKSNFVLFQVGGSTPSFTMVRYYESTSRGGNPPLNAFVYELRYSSPNDPGTIDVTISVVDGRGIKVTGQRTNLSTIDV